ncbi:MAG: uracil-DNA glycosylase [Candidatus Nomurabacteria bacterium]|jgi:uracil-DNA glycosylase|nr:uracil-DNA glycosylase [Candidatus Nomurabacteria bacterium]
MHESWKPFLQNQFGQDYFHALSNFLHQEYIKKQIFPPKAQVFSAFTTDFNAIKVVIIGQDPYHGDHQAHGLAFSVNKSVAIPPSLQNIFKEIHDDLGTPIPTHGNLQKWSQQGVLLLNNTLTVEAHRAGSHRNHGWEQFTEAVVKKLNQDRQNLVFILWGRDARSKKSLIDTNKHLVLEAAHPSPFSAYSGFFGCKHFSQTNAYLRAHNESEIIW